MQNDEMCVLKRDGSKQTVSFDKILTRAKLTKKQIFLFHTLVLL